MPLARWYSKARAWNTWIGSTSPFLDGAGQGSVLFREFRNAAWRS